MGDQECHLQPVPAPLTITTTPELYCVLCSYNHDSILEMIVSKRILFVDTQLLRKLCKRHVKSNLGARERNPKRAISQDYIRLTVSAFSADSAPYVILSF